jgi:hypothetical protein
MKRLILFFHVVSVSLCLGQTVPDSALYLGQTPPGNTAKKFILPASVNYFVAEKIAISPSETELYFCELNGYPWSASKVKQFKYTNNAWAGPFDIFSGFIAPVFSPGGDTLYFEDGQPYAWYSIRNGTGWNAPARFWTSSHKQHNLQTVNSRKYYVVSDPVISTNGDISRLLTQNSDTSVQSLGIPVNSASNGMDFFIAKDESYIIRVIKSNGLGMLFISYRKADGTWTNPKNLGPQVNAPQAWEWGPYVTNDNKYLFFTRQVSSIDIFWVRIDNVIDSLKHINSIPYLKTQIPNQVDTVGRPLTYRISDTTFIDDDGNNTLSYTATLNSGSSLPAWLFFDTTAKTFSGVPTAAGTFTIKVTAKDTASASVSASFTLTVAPPSINYFGQVPPGDNAMIFTPGAFSQPDRPEHAGVFSRDGKVFYFCVTTMNWNTFNTYMRKFIDGSWTTETLASFSSISGGAAEVFINKQNTRIFFVSKGTGFTSDGWIKTDFWTAEGKGDSLGNPMKLSSTINDIDVQWHPSISDSGHIYFGSKGSVYRADCMNDTIFSPPAKLNDPNINFAGSNNAEVYIAPDESYLIFSSNRPGGYGGNDLYISYKKKDTTWGTPVNLGSKINSGSADFSPGLTPDGKYLLFSRDDGITRHIYWVSSSFIDSIRQIAAGVRQEKNNVPVEKSLLQNYPNPFNPTTTISFSLPSRSRVSLKIFDVLGREVATLVSEYLAAGIHTRQWNAAGFPSGTYFYRFQAGDFIDTKRLVLIK